MSTSSTFDPAMISSDGVQPYQVSMLFEGFPHRQTKQDIREEGSVQAPVESVTDSQSG